MARILGLDIDERSVRAAWLESSFRSAQLENIGYADIAPTFDDEGKVEAFREAIRTVLAGMKPPDQVVVALSGLDASLRAIELAPGLAGKIGEVLPHELAELLPFEMSDLIIDHQVTRQSPTELRILAASARKDVIREKLEQLKNAGVEPRELAVGAATLDGLLGIVPSLALGGPHLLVHVGLQATDLCIVADGRCVSARTVTEGADALDSGRANLVTQQIQRSIASYRSDGGAPIASVHVSGIRDPRVLASYLEAALEVPAGPTELPAILGVDSLALPPFARAIALASRSLRKGRRFDLRKGEFAPPRAITGLREYAGSIAFGIALVFVSFIFSTYVRYSALDAEHEALSAQMRATTRSLFGREATSAAEARTLLEGGTAVADPRPRLDAFAILDLISHKVPAPIRHSTNRLRVEIDDEARDGRFEIAGVVPTIADRDSIASGIEQHECVTRVDRGPTTPAPNNAGQNYRLEGDLQCPGDEPIQHSNAGTGASSMRGGR